MNTIDSTTGGHVLDAHIYKILGASAVVLILVGTLVYHLVEAWSWVDSLYFSVVAVTTVGFGDIAPSTDGSKLFTVFYVLAGISIITAYLHARMNRTVNRRVQS